MANLNLVTMEDLQQMKAEFIDEIKRIIKQDLKSVNSKEWLRSSEVRELLKISSGTLQNLRIKGILPYEKIGGIFYYAHSDIEQLLGELGNS